MVCPRQSANEFYCVFNVSYLFDSYNLHVYYSFFPSRRLSKVFQKKCIRIQLSSTQLKCIICICAGCWFFFSFISRLFVPKFTFLVNNIFWSVYTVQVSIVVPFYNARDIVYVFCMFVTVPIFYFRFFPAFIFYSVGLVLYWI